MVDCEINTLPLHTPKGRKGSPFFLRLTTLGKPGGSLRAPLFLFEQFLDVLWILGGISTIVSSGNDANSLVSPGNYFWGSYTNTPQNMPLQMAGWMRIDVFGIMIVQRVFYNFGGGSTKPSVYERNKWGDDWGDWSRLDNFGCRTLAELKAALANV